MIGLVDVSHWQGLPNWYRATAAGTRFRGASLPLCGVLAKCTEGWSYYDASYNYNYDNALAAGLAFGSYHWFHANLTDQARQIAWLETHYRKPPASKDLGLWIDVEDVDDLTVFPPPRTAILDRLIAFLDHLRQDLPGVPINIYTANWYWSQLSPNLCPRFGTALGYRLWVAHYQEYGTPILPYGWDQYLIWQYTSSAHIDGISGHVDANVYNGTLAELVAMINPVPVTWIARYRVYAVWLTVRTGPGVGYAAVRYLAFGTTIYVYEIINVAGTNWGRIGADEWCSLAWCSKA